MTFGDLYTQVVGSAADNVGVKAMETEEGLEAFRSTADSLIEELTSERGAKMYDLPRPISARLARKLRTRIKNKYPLENEIQSGTKHRRRRSYRSRRNRY